MLGLPAPEKMGYAGAAYPVTGHLPAQLALAGGRYAPGKWAATLSKHFHTLSRSLFFPSILFSRFCSLGLLFQEMTGRVHLSQPSLHRHRHYYCCARI